MLEHEVSFEENNTPRLALLPADKLVLLGGSSVCTHPLPRPLHATPDQALTPGGGVSAGLVEQEEVEQEEEEEEEEEEEAMGERQGRRVG